MSSSTDIQASNNSAFTKIGTKGNSCLFNLLDERAKVDAAAPDMAGENGDPCYSDLGFKTKDSEQLVSNLLGLKQQLVGNDSEMISSIINDNWPKVVANLSSISKEDRENHIVLLFKLCFFSRAIRCQGNRSRVQFYLLFQKLREEFPNETLEVVPLIPHYGCFQDIDHLVTVFGHLKDVEMYQKLLGVYCDSLKHDIDRLFNKDTSTMKIGDIFNGVKSLNNKLRSMNPKQLDEFIKSLPEGQFSLAGKWLKREGKKNSRHRDDLVFLMFPKINRSNSKSVTYGRQLLRYIGATLSQCVRVVEQNMTEGIERGWSDIQLKHVPSKATTNYRKAFINEDKLGNERFDSADRRLCAQNTLKSIMEGKLNGAQSDLKALADLIWKNVETNYGSSRMSDAERKLINVQWKKLVEFVNNLIEETLEKDKKLRQEAEEAGETVPEPIRDPRAVLPVTDVSGSMSGAGVMHYAILMSILCASISTIPGKLITFSDKPTVFSFDPNEDIFTLVRLIQRCEWGMTTNLDAVYKLLLKEMKTARDAGKEISTDFSVLIVTDGQFNNMVTYNSVGENSWSAPKADISEFDTFQTRWEKVFTAENFGVPLVVYWNMALQKPGFPAQSSTTGVKLVAGFSQTIMVEVMTGSYKIEVDEETGAVKVSVTPLESFMKTMNDDSLELVKIKLTEYWSHLPAPSSPEIKRQITMDDKDEEIADLEKKLAAAKDKRIQELKDELKKLEVSTI